MPSASSRHDGCDGAAGCRTPGRQLAALSLASRCARAGTVPSMAALHSWAGRARDPHWHTDATLALAIGAVELIAVLVLAHLQPDRRALDSTGIALLAIGAAGLVVRREYPVGVLGLAYTTTLLYWIRDYPRGPIFLAVMVAVFTAATAGHRVAAWGSLLLGFAAFPWLPYLLGNEGEPGAPTIFGLAGGCWCWRLLPRSSGSGASANWRPCRPERKNRGGRSARSESGLPGRCTTSSRTASR